MRQPTLSIAALLLIQLSSLPIEVLSMEAADVAKLVGSATETKAATPASNGKHEEVPLILRPEQPLADGHPAHTASNHRQPEIPGKVLPESDAAFYHPTTEAPSKTKVNEKLTEAPSSPKVDEKSTEALSTPKVDEKSTEGRLKPNTDEKSTESSKSSRSSRFFKKLWKSLKSVYRFMTTGLTSSLYRSGRPLTRAPHYLIRTHQEPWEAMETDQALMIRELKDFKEDDLLLQAFRRSFFDDLPSILESPTMDRAKTIDFIRSHEGHLLKIPGKASTFEQAEREKQILFVKALYILCRNDEIAPEVLRTMDRVTSEIRTRAPEAQPMLTPYILAANYLMGRTHEPESTWLGMAQKLQGEKHGDLNREEQEYPEMREIAELKEPSSEALVEKIRAASLQHSPEFAFEASYPADELAIRYIKVYYRLAARNRDPVTKAAIHNLYESLTRQGAEGLHLHSERVRKYISVAHELLLRIQKNPNGALLRSDLKQDLEKFEMNDWLNSFRSQQKPVLAKYYQEMLVDAKSKTPFAQIIEWSGSTLRPSHLSTSEDFLFALKTLYVHAVARTQAHGAENPSLEKLIEARKLWVKEQPKSIEQVAAIDSVIDAIVRDARDFDEDYPAMDILHDHRQEVMEGKTPVVDEQHEGEHTSTPAESPSTRHTPSIWSKLFKKQTN